MARLGASISDRVNLSVTHILYRAGRKKTHDWAVKHGVPMVTVSWPLACIKAKRLISHEPYQLPAGAWSADDGNAAGGTSSPLLNQLRKAQRRRFMQPGLDHEKQLKSSADRLRRKRMKTALVDSLTAACQKSAEEYQNFNDNYYLSVKIRVPTTPPSMKEFQERLEQQRRAGIRFNGSLSDSSTVDSDNESAPKKTLVLASDTPAVATVIDTSETSSAAAQQQQQQSANAPELQKTLVELSPVCALTPTPAPVPAPVPVSALAPAGPVTRKSVPGKRRLYNAETDDMCASFSDSLSSSQASIDATPTVSRRGSGCAIKSRLLLTSAETPTLPGRPKRRSSTRSSFEGPPTAIGICNSAEERRYNRRQRSLMMLQHQNNQLDQSAVAVSAVSSKFNPPLPPPPLPLSQPLRRPFEGVDLSETPTSSVDSLLLENLPNGKGNNSNKNKDGKARKFRRLYNPGDDDDDDELIEQSNSPAPADLIACYRSFPKPVLQMLAQDSDNQAAKHCVAPSPGQIIASLPGRGGDGRGATEDRIKAKPTSNITVRARFGQPRSSTAIARQLPCLKGPAISDLQTGLVAILKANGRFETPCAKPQQQKQLEQLPTEEQVCSQLVTPTPSSSQLSTASSTRKSILQLASNKAKQHSRRITFASNVDIASLESIANRSSAPLKCPLVEAISATNASLAAPVPASPTVIAPAPTSTPVAPPSCSSSAASSLSPSSPQDYNRQGSSPRVALWDIRRQSNLDNETQALLDNAIEATSDTKASAAAPVASRSSSRRSSKISEPATLLDIAEESSAASSQTSTNSSSSGLGILDACETEDSKKASSASKNNPRHSKSKTNVASKQKESENSVAETAASSANGFNGSNSRPRRQSALRIASGPSVVDSPLFPSTSVASNSASSSTEFSRTAFSATTKEVSSNKASTTEASVDAASNIRRPLKRRRSQRNASHADSPVSNNIQPTKNNKLGNKKIVSQEKINSKTAPNSQGGSSTASSSRRSLDDFQLPLMSITGLSGEQKRDVKKTLSRMPETYRLLTAETVSAQTAVLVTPNPPRRTLALLTGMALGVPIISIDWLTDSLSRRSWLPMKPYSLAKQTRDLVSRLANKDYIDDNEKAGIDLRSELFIQLAEMYVAPQCFSSGIANSDSKKAQQQLINLIESAGGRISDSYRSAPICIGCSRSNALSVSPVWIIDCVLLGRVLQAKDYPAKDTSLAIGIDSLGTIVGKAFNS